MKAAINIHRLIPLVLASLLVTLAPALFFLYLATLFLCTISFIVILIIDLLAKRDLRKKSGLILANMYVVAILATGVFYVVNSFN